MRKRQRLHQPSYRYRPRLTDGQRRALRASILQEYLEPEAAAAHVGVRVSDIDDELMSQLRKDFRQATSFLRSNLLRNIDPSDDADWRILHQQLLIRDKLMDRWDNMNGSGEPAHHRITVEFIEPDGRSIDFEPFETYQPRQRLPSTSAEIDELPDVDEDTETEVERACRLRGSWFPGDI